MRFAPPAAALSLVVALTASVSWGQQRDPAPGAQVLLSQGETALEQGEVQAAIDAFEAALAVDPGYTPTLILLAEASRAEQLQGKAIGYYREALAREPRNIAAIAGEGEALAEKGAIAKAQEMLTRVESLCGGDCPEAQAVSAAIAAGPVTPVQTAEVTLSEEQKAMMN
ncbi:tetratricopeptide repeat protein [Erythrobacter litoralis]|uniref:tetratricopeptide repeat protein n=1 Tax=Erythrobacter litoralis TaxID=39960 RepID=UPI0024360D01|nr:tetratricopeptide repeat protein [Erythrobacter litoralis]